ncbi:MAG: hypothetical protein OXI67_11300 [Candidatus Poribacteria bacterium]|nr:hypothetical protein [Candidatus Poribacteria bacterium]
MTDAVNYIPFQRVKDWKVGDRVVVDGNPGKIRDIIEFKNPSGTGETIASIGVVYDNEPGIIRLVEFDFHQVKLEREHHSNSPSG